MTSSSEARSNPSGTAGRPAFACCLLPAAFFPFRSSHRTTAALPRFCFLRTFGARFANRQGSLRLIGMTCEIHAGVSFLSTANNSEWRAPRARRGSVIRVNGF